MKVLTIGSALVDIFITSPHFKLNEDGSELNCAADNGKLEVSSFVLTTGGGAGNVAVGLSRQGHQVSVLAELGQDHFADIVRQDLVTEGVATDFLIAERQEQTGGAVILVTDSGERMVMVHRGAASQLDPADVQPEQFSNLDWLHLSSLGQQTATVQKIHQLARAQNIKLSWNPGRSELMALVNGGIQINEIAAEVLFVNQEEWQIVAPIKSALIEQIATIVITNGAQDGQIISAGKISTYQVPVVQAIDSTGAGDAFAAGFIGGMLQVASIEKCLAMAVQNSASAVMKMGAKSGLLRQFPSE